jgi:tetratricopeptide (TPR) repeat protein
VILGDGDLTLTKRLSNAMSELLTDRSSLSFLALSWRRLLILLFISIVFPVSVFAQTPDSEAAEKDWKAVAPQIALFWKMVEESPSAAGGIAWPVISTLRHFIQKHPDAQEAAQAYYLLGEAYSRVSYIPEAMAHWRIVAKRFPDSPWASEALTSMLFQVEHCGDSGKFEQFNRELIRQYPDSNAAKTAWVIFAIEAVDSGDMDQIKKDVAGLDATRPNLYIDVPRFLDLKARLAASDGNEEEARIQWTHYLNLIRSPAQRAETLFRIAESCRRSGKTIAARRYYSMIKHSYPNFPAALFARFRMSQLEASEKKRLSAYVSNAIEPAASGAMDGVLTRIIEEFPAHPLTREVELELMAVRLDEGEYVEVLRLGQRFVQVLPGGPFLDKILAICQRARDALEGIQNPEILNDAVTFGRGLVETDQDSPLAPGMTETTQSLWLKLMELLFARQDFAAVVKEAQDFYEVFSGSQAVEKARACGIRALLAYDRQLLAEGRPLELLNQHYAHLEKIRGLGVSEHAFHVGEAWIRLDCPAAAMRAFHEAWNLGPEKNEMPELLLTWAETALDAGDLVSAGSILDILYKTAPTEADNPWALWLDARLSGEEGDWIKAIQKTERGLSIENTSQMKKRLQVAFFEASMKLGHWSEAISVWGELALALTKDEQVSLLRLWGDETLWAGRHPEALDAYNRLLTMEPENLQYAWRASLAKHHMGSGKAAREEWKALTQAPDELWAQAARAMIENERFWSGPAGEFRYALKDPVSAGAMGGLQ